MDEKYREMFEKYKEFIKTGKSSDEIDYMEDELLVNNNFENFLNREIAEKIIENQQQSWLDTEGGWPLWDERSFEVSGQEYSVIAWGTSSHNEGKDAFQGMVFVREDDESKKLRQWGRNKIERNFVRFNKYLDEIKNGLRKPDGMDEFGVVPYVCERCKKAEAAVLSSRGNFCNKCDAELVKKENK